MKTLQDLEDKYGNIIGWYELKGDIQKVMDVAEKRGQESERKSIVKQVEDTIAEFGEQGIECVASILDESFHGKQEVEY